MGLKRKKVCGLDPEFGAIFMSNTQTKQECLKKQLFGLPFTHCNFVSKVKVGMRLFLFDYQTRKLHGVFEAVSDGEVNIVPSAYRYSTGKSFPAQVRVRRIMHCRPLSEYEFSGVIKDNYYSLKKFNFGLSKHQVQDLIFLFKSRNVGESSKYSREKKVRRQGGMSSRKVQRHQYDDEKIIVPPQDVVSQVGGECVLCSSSSSRSSKKLLSASSQSHQIQEIYQTADSFMCCENETPVMVDGCPLDDDLGDFIPLPESSDEEDHHDPAEEDDGGTEWLSSLLGTMSKPNVGGGGESSQLRIADKEESLIAEEDGGGDKCLSSLLSTISRPYVGGGGESSQLIGTTSQRIANKEESLIAEEDGGGNECLSSLLSTRSRPYVGGGGESSQLIGTTRQRFADKEESGIVGGSVDFAAPQSYTNNNNNVSSNDAVPAIICHDDSNTLCTTASGKNVLLCNDVGGVLYCDTVPQKRTSVFSRLNWRNKPQENEIRARADKFVDEIMEEMQNKNDFGGMLLQLKKQKCAAAELVDEEEQIILHPNRNPDHQEGGSSVFQRLGARIGGSR